MAVSFGCRCEERSKPVRERNWVVVQLRCNHSAFSGYRMTPSDYSTVRCLRCGVSDAAPGRREILVRRAPRSGRHDHRVAVQGGTYPIPGTEPDHAIREGVTG